MDPKADLAKADLMMSQHDAKIMGKPMFWEEYRRQMIAIRMAKQGNADTQKSKIEAAQEKRRRKAMKRIYDVPPSDEALSAVLERMCATPPNDVLSMELMDFSVVKAEDAMEHCVAWNPHAGDDDDDVRNPAQGHTKEFMASLKKS